MCCVGLGDIKHPITSTVCASSCPAGQYAMCRMGGGPCPAGRSCQRINELDTVANYGYRICK